MPRFAVDFSPLKRNRNLRYMFFSGIITRFGSALTLVALPFQLKELTHSYIAVGAMGAVEIIPLTIFILWGGVIADRVDRKKMVWRCEAGALLFSAILLGNSLLHSPHLLLLYFVGAGFAAVDGLQGPSYSAMLPRLVSTEDLPSAMALLSLRWQFSAIIGPALAGVIIATSGVKAAYSIDIVSYILSVGFLIRITSVPPLKEATSKSIKAMLSGLRYAASRRDLMGTYFIDVAAMFFAMPNALFPFWADQIHSRWALGFFYTAGIMGSLVITATSGWIKHFTRHGWAITFAAIGWGIFIALAGTTNSLWLVLLFLGLAGASDQVSALCRSTLWNQTIDDEYRGRLAGLEQLSYSVGPLAAQLRAGTTASITTLRTSVISGGLLCVGIVSVVAAKFPEFRHFDLKTNPYAIEQRAKRSQQSEGN